MTENSFNSSRRQIVRAEEHILDLAAKIKAFLETKPYARIVEPDSDGINQLHKVKLTKLVPLSFADIAADAVNNLRTALDHAGYTTALASGKVNARKAYFPFGIDAADLENTIRSQCKDIPQDIITLMRSFQPYKGGNDLLWALNRMCGTNKHRMLAPIGVTVGGMHIRQMMISGSGSIPCPIWDRTKHEIVFAIMGPHTKIEYDIELAFSVAFDEVEIVGGQPAIPVLNQMASIVEGIVTGIEAEARRLGLIS
jgi:hypothetical protein